jgi:3-hydroxypropanoate dehydrogenase
MAAPVTVIIAYDLKFYDKLPRLFPHKPAIRDMFVENPQLIQQTALRSSTLQVAMILAARALGLDCRPMSGFDNAKLDEEFFAACSSPFSNATHPPYRADSKRIGPCYAKYANQSAEAGEFQKRFVS